MLMALSQLLRGSFLISQLQASEIANVVALNCLPTPVSAKSPVALDLWGFFSVLEVISHTIIVCHWYDIRARSVRYSFENKVKCLIEIHWDIEKWKNDHWSLVGSPFCCLKDGKSPQRKTCSLVGIIRWFVSVFAFLDCLAKTRLTGFCTESLLTRFLISRVNLFLPACFLLRKKSLSQADVHPFASKQCTCTRKGFTFPYS